MSFSFQGVSIPYVQLLMRGDILIIAPLVDIVFGRRVRWWSRARHFVHNIVNSHAPKISSAFAGNQPESDIDLFVL